MLDEVEKKEEKGDEPDVKMEERKENESQDEKRETTEEKLMKDIKGEKDNLHEKEEKKMPLKLEEKEDMKNILDEKKEKKKEKKAVIVIKNSWKDLPDQVFSFYPPPLKKIYHNNFSNVFKKIFLTVFFYFDLGSTKKFNFFFKYSQKGINSTKKKRFKID